MAKTKAAKSSSETSKPSFEGRGKLTEYHKTPAGEHLSGHRFVFTVPDPKLKMGDDKSLTKRTRFGKLVVNYFPDPDHAAKIELPGKFKAKAEFPIKDTDAGVWKVAFQPSEVNGDDLHRLIGLEHKETDVDLSFAGSYNQKEIFPEVAEAEQNFDD